MPPCLAIDDSLMNQKSPGNDATRIYQRIHVMQMQDTRKISTRVKYCTQNGDDKPANHSFLSCRHLQHSSLPPLLEFKEFGVQLRILLFLLLLMHLNLILSHDNSFS